MKYVPGILGIAAIVAMTIVSAARGGWVAVAETWLIFAFAVGVYCLGIMRGIRSERKTREFSTHVSTDQERMSPGQ